MANDKTITMPVKEITHLKIILATWYSYLREHLDTLAKSDFDRFLKTPVIYNLEKDEIEVLITGTEELLKGFSNFVARAR